MESSCGHFPELGSPHLVIVCQGSNSLYICFNDRNPYENNINKASFSFEIILGVRFFYPSSLPHRTLQSAFGHQPCNCCINCIQLRCLVASSPLVRGTNLLDSLVRPGGWGMGGLGLNVLPPQKKMEGISKSSTTKISLGKADNMLFCCFFSSSLFFFHFFWVMLKKGTCRKCLAATEVENPPTM